MPSFQIDYSRHGLLVFIPRAFLEIESMRSLILNAECLRWFQL